MRAVIQRVRRARVSVDGSEVGAIGPGLLVLVAVATPDGEAQARWLAKKTVQLRIFPDAEDRMNRSVVDTGGEVLVVSQFTLYGDCRKGNRPSFIESARPEAAEPLYLRYAAMVAEYGPRVATGVFGAMMDVELVNDGPVTLVVDTPVDRP